MAKYHNIERPKMTDTIVGWPYVGNCGQRLWRIQREYGAGWTMRSSISFERWPDYYNARTLGGLSKILDSLAEKYAALPDWDVDVTFAPARSIGASDQNKDTVRVRASSAEWALARAIWVVHSREDARNVAARVCRRVK